jgi:hypothetical protein
VQITLVAAPRNQPQSRRLIDGAICLCVFAQRHDGRKFTEKLDLQPAIAGGRAADLFGKPAQRPSSSNLSSRPTERQTARGISREAADAARCRRDTRTC